MSGDGIIISIERRMDRPAPGGCADKRQGAGSKIRQAGAAAACCWLVAGCKKIIRITTENHRKFDRKCENKEHPVLIPYVYRDRVFLICCSDEMSG